MLQRESSAICLTFIKLTFDIKIFDLSVFEWPFYTGFTVLQLCSCSCVGICVLCVFLSITWVVL